LYITTSLEPTTHQSYLLELLLLDYQTHPPEPSSVLLSCIGSTRESTIIEPRLLTVLFGGLLTRQAFPYVQLLSSKTLQYGKYSQAKSQQVYEGQSPKHKSEHYSHPAFLLQLIMPTRKPVLPTTTHRIASCW
jgi:hypothetical protein